MYELNREVFNKANTMNIIRYFIHTMNFEERLKGMLLSQS